jgi:hypothetical protein
MIPVGPMCTNCALPRGLHGSKLRFSNLFGAGIERVRQEAGRLLQPGHRRVKIDSVWTRWSANVGHDTMLSQVIPL